MANLPANRRDEPLTLQQLMAIEMLLIREIKKITYAEIAEACGVSERTLQRWRRLPEFQKEYRRRALEVLGDSLPQVLKVLEKKALQGSNKSIELYLKTLGMLKSEMDVTARQAPPVDQRSNEAIEREIKELERELGLTDDNNDNEGDE